MDKFPLCWKGNAIGELTTERENLYTRFAVRCCLPEEGIWCAWAVGTQGELRLGVLEPCGDHAELCRRFSDRMAAPLGRLLRGELRGVEAGSVPRWMPLRSMPFQTPWLRRQMQERMDILTRTAAKLRYLAIPYAPGKPFPLVPLFCFAQVCRIDGRDYAVFAFDEEEWPVFPEILPGSQ